MSPTIVLVHGAFAEWSRWDGVIEPLLYASHPVIAAPNPLRGVAADAAAALQHFMEERAGARSTIEIPGAAHAISVSHPEAVAPEVLGAAALRAAA